MALPVVRRYTSVVGVINVFNNMTDDKTTLAQFTLFKPNIILDIVNDPPIADPILCPTPTGPPAPIKRTAPITIAPKVSTVLMETITFRQISCVINLVEYEDRL